MRLLTMAWVFVPYLVACGARSSLTVSKDDTGGATELSLPAPSVHTQAATCNIASELREVDAIPPGALCTDALPDVVGGKMTALVGRTLYDLTGHSVIQRHNFMTAREPGFVAGGGSVVVRGDWVSAIAYQIRHPSHDREGAAEAELVLHPRNELPRYTLRLPAMPFNGSSASTILTANAAGVVAVSFSVPPSQVFRVVSVRGDVTVEKQDMEPLTDPDDKGFVGVYDRAAQNMMWLNGCTGETTPIRRALLSNKTWPVPWNADLLYVDKDTSTLIRESSDRATQWPLPASPPITAWLDLHSSGWALLTTTDPRTLVTVHVGTGETRTLSLTWPQGFRRYGSLTSGMPEYGSFDPTIGELRVTSRGGALIALRNDSLGYLFASETGSNWQALGRPVGEVYVARGIESGGVYVHTANAFAVTIPAWAPAPAESQRIDHQSTQLIRAKDERSIVVEQAPKGQTYNHIYRLSVDGSCLATHSYVGTQVNWANSVTFEKLGMYIGTPNASLSPHLTWATGSDARLTSIR